MKRESKIETIYPNGLGLASVFRELCESNMVVYSVRHSRDLSDKDAKLNSDHEVYFFCEDCGEIIK